MLLHAHGKELSHARLDTVQSTAGLGAVRAQLCELLLQLALAVLALGGVVQLLQDVRGARRDRSNVRLAERHAA